MPTISVITPVYKVEKYLKKCIDSILEQTFSDFELIIVDDGSPDSCGNIADEYEKIDSRVHVIHKENGGAPSARNAGMRIATGEFYFFPDSDDWIEPTYLQELYETATKTDALMVISGYTMEYFENNKGQSYKVVEPYQNYSDKELVRSNIHRYFDNMMMAVPWNKLYKAEYLKSKNLVFPNLKWDDLHFNMDVIMDIESVAICSSSGYHFFRSRQGSETTTVFDGLLYQKRREQFEHILKVYTHWNVKDPEIMSVIYGYYSARLVQCVQEIAISQSNQKRKLVKDILMDDFNITAIQSGKIQSRYLALAIFPMRMKNVSGSILMGKAMGFFKIHMSSVFYRIKSISVNHARTK
ncbi:MAG: glycosyltransferase [Lachnospiraceae bacterium]|nr:glycosyltransferase [Lachnospiraceae bacterium]